MKVLRRKEIREAFAFCPRCNRIIPSFHDVQKRKTFKLFRCKDCELDLYPEEVLELPRNIVDYNEPANQSLQRINLPLEGEDTGTDSDRQSTDG